MQILSFLAFLRIVLLSLSMLFFLSAEETVFKTIPFSPLPSDRPYANRNLSAEARAQAVLQAMTLDEKLNAVGGFQLMFSPPLPRLGLRPLLFSDASQGIHLRDDIVTRLKQSTAFPCTLALAATWDPELAVLYAQSIGEECRAGDIAVLLGPGMNIYRSSECGRNFEYLGEDPYLAGRLVSSYVTGLQKTGTMATLKHFLGNNSEYLRATSDSVISERAIHEIYTPAFKAGIDAGAGAVMTSYNLVNGEWVGHSPIWVDQLLRKELGFKGLVMSDWGAIQENEKFMTTAIDLCMPDLKGIYLTDLFKEKKFSEKDLDAKILRWLTAFFKMGFYDRPQEDLSFLKKLPAHDAVALRTAQESIILLSNRNHILPLQAQTYHKILLVGPAAKGVWGHLPAPKPPAKKSSGLLGGGGSGGVEGNHLVSLKDALFHEFIF
ncbi:MAG: glycoside hydrolase family 3 N-terminal domain-containing protein [Verrucomicrobiota bacterium]